MAPHSSAALLLAAVCYTICGAGFSLSCGSEHQERLRAGGKGEQGPCRAHARPWWGQAHGVPSQHPPVPTNRRLMPTNAHTCLLHAHRDPRVPTRAC